MNDPIQLEREVRWGELDAFGHVNNTVFFRWFEDVRIACFQKIGIAWEPPLSVGPILATTTARFQAPLKFPARVQVGCRIDSIGTTSFIQHYRVTCDGSVVAEGSAVVVMIDYENGGKVPVSDDVRRAINAL